MSTGRTLGDLSLGTHVWLYEKSGSTEVPVLYYLLKKSALNGILLRAECLMAKRMHSSAEANYPDALGEGSGDGTVCEADKWLCTTFISTYLPNALQMALSPETIKYYDLNCKYSIEPQTIEIARRVFLLSSTELGYRTTPDEGPSIFDALCTATNKTGNAARIGYNASATAVSLWLRSAHSASNFRRVYADGYEDNHSATSASFWLRPALSVALATSVSPEGTDDIFLLPDPEKTHRDVGGTAILGTTTRRPTSAKLLVTMENVFDADLKICNNANDAAPAWEDATPNTTHVFTNTTKTADKWALGFKFYAKSYSIGRIISPSIIDIEEAAE